MLKKYHDERKNGCSSNVRVAAVRGLNCTLWALVAFLQGNYVNQSKHGDLKIIGWLALCIGKHYRAGHWQQLKNKYL